MPHRITAGGEAWQFLLRYRALWQVRRQFRAYAFEGDDRAARPIAGGAPDLISLNPLSARRLWDKAIDVAAAVLVRELNAELLGLSPRDRMIKTARFIEGWTGEVAVMCDDPECEQHGPMRSAGDLFAMIEPSARRFVRNAARELSPLSPGERLAQSEAAIQTLGITAAGRQKLPPFDELERAAGGMPPDFWDWVAVHNVAGAG